MELSFANGRKVSGRSAESLDIDSLWEAHGIWRLLTGWMPKDYIDVCVREAFLLGM
jgi:hypothetical protein